MTQENSYRVFIHAVFVEKRLIYFDKDYVLAVEVPFIVKFFEFALEEDKALILIDEKLHLLGRRAV